MIDFGLPGGWTAGGLATDPGVPAIDFAPATGVLDETGVAALDAAFRNLIDALTPAVDPSTLEAAGGIRTIGDSADSAEPPPEVAPEVTPASWPTQPAAGGSVLSFLSLADRSRRPHPAVSGDQQTHAAPKAETDDPAAINIVVGTAAPIAVVEAPAAPPVSNSRLTADRPAEDIDARTNTNQKAPNQKAIPAYVETKETVEAPAAPRVSNSTSTLTADRLAEEIDTRTNTNQKAPNQKAIPAYQAQVHSAAIAAGVRAVTAASQPAPVEPSEEPVETKETTVSAAKLQLAASSAAIPEASTEFDPNPQRDQSEARRSAFTLTFSKPLGHNVRAAAATPERVAESIAFSKPGSAPPSILTFTVPVPAALTASSATALAVPVTFSPGLQARQETADQIVQAIRLTWTRGGGEAHIRLDPQQFGGLSIALRVDRGEVVARLQAETSEVRDWLRTNQHLLREGLAQHDLRLDRLEIAASAEERQDARDADDERRDQRDEGRRPAHRKARAPETSAVFDIVA